MFAFQVSSLFCPLNPSTTHHQTPASWWSGWWATFLGNFFPKSIFCKCIFAKCTQFASLFAKILPVFMASQKGCWRQAIKFHTLTELADTLTRTKNEVKIYTFLQESVNIFGVFPICECLKNLRKFDIKSVLENVLCQVYSPAVPLLRWKDQQVGSLKRKREGTWSLIQS